jgi:hypothetical protein
VKQERLPVNCIKLTSTDRGRALMLMIVKVVGSVVTPAVLTSALRSSGNATREV